MLQLLDIDGATSYAVPLTSMRAIGFSNSEHSSEEDAAAHDQSHC